MIDYFFMREDFFKSMLFQIKMEILTCLCLKYCFQLGVLLLSSHPSCKGQEIGETLRETKIVKTGM